MKLFILLLMALFITNCSNIGTGKTYWCGDHACISKDEKDDYFKKTMIVEIREIVTKSDKKSIKNNKKLIKQAKLEKAKVLKDKKKIKLEEQKLDRKVERDAKKRLLDEKKMKKMVKLEQKKKKSENKKNKLKDKKVKKIENYKIKEDDLVLNKSKSVDEDLSMFYRLAEAIIKKNSLKPYPNINNIPE